MLYTLQSKAEAILIRILTQYLNHLKLFFSIHRVGSVTLQHNVEPCDVIIC